MIRMTDRLLQFVRRRPHDVAFVLFIAACLGGVISLNYTIGDLGDEMIRLAGTLVKEGSFAHPFKILTTGPTAMNPPLYPLILAGIFTIFRIPILQMGAMIFGSIVANGVTAAMLPRVSQIFFDDTVPGVFAALFWLSMMANMPGWDTSLTVAGLLYFLILSAKVFEPGKAPIRSSILAGLVAGMLFLMNPSTSLIFLPWVVYLAGIKLWRKAARKLILRQAAILLLVFSLFPAGWGIRNKIDLGAFVERTNLGATLYSSNNDCAQPSMIRDLLAGCYQQYHPNASMREAQAVEQMGEPAYDRSRIALTKVWIGAHPARFGQLTAARFMQFWFPAIELIPPDDLSIGFTIPEARRNVLLYQNRVAVAVRVMMAFSIPGLVLMAVRREPVTMFVLVTLLLYPLLYYIVVSDMRYRYPVLFLSLLPAGYLVRAAFSLRIRGENSPYSDQ
jgi:hypothetical protein